MKYIKIVLFTTIVMILVLFAVRNQDRVSFVLGYKTTYEKDSEIKEDIKKELEPKGEKEIETEAGVVGREETESGAGIVTREEGTDLEMEKAPEPMVETEISKTTRTIGYEKEFEIPLFLILFIEAFVLVVLMSLVGVFEDISLRNRIREVTKENKRLKSELNVIKKAEKDSEKPKISKTEEKVSVPEVKSTTVKKPDKGKKVVKKKSLLDKVKGEKSPPSKGSDEDKGL